VDFPEPSIPSNTTNLGHGGDGWGVQCEVGKSMG
jgi:hypothetical protein